MKSKTKTLLLEKSAKLEEPPSCFLKRCQEILIKNQAKPKEKWQEILSQSFYLPKQIAQKFNLPLEEIKQICVKYPARVNPYYFSLIKEKGDPIYKQCIPDIKELQDASGLEDPLNEEPEHQKRQNVPSLLTHRYPDRILFRISNQCAMYCRFCTRKRKVGDPLKQPTWEQISNAFDYIRKHKEIRDVILSGGDPLMLANKQLEKILKAVYEIMRLRKNGIIRIGTRIPCSLPQRITQDLCQMLKKYHPLYINTHFNHPNEITRESKRACGMLADAGMPLGNQTVLLKGVNDDPKVMKKLMQGLVSMRVRPYYIYQADPVKGTNHFRTKVEKGIEIYKALRGHTSGLCVPAYVIDAPGGGGKIPLLPNYLLKIDDKKVILKNYEGSIHKYPQV
jgi:lysine 2,3-aminomutase